MTNAFCLMDDEAAVHIHTPVVHGASGCPRVNPDIYEMQLQLAISTYEACYLPRMALHNNMTDQVVRMLLADCKHICKSLCVEAKTPSQHPVRLQEAYAIGRVC